MKAVVLEIKNGVAAVLREDGTVIKIRQKCQVGDVIELPDTSGNFTSSAAFRKGMKIAAAAAAAVILTVGAGGYYLSASAAGVVTVYTETTQVKLSVNHFGRVIRIETEDENEDLYKELQDVQNAAFEEALTKVSEMIRSHESAEEPELPAVYIENEDSSFSKGLKEEAVRQGFEVAAPQDRKAPESPSAPEAVNPETTLSGQTAPGEIDAPFPLREDTPEQGESSGEAMSEQPESSGEEMPEPAESSGEEMPEQPESGGEAMPEQPASDGGAMPEGNGVPEGDSQGGGQPGF